MKNQINKMLISFVLIVLLITIGVAIFRANEVDALSKYGSSGEEVKQIQTKLKNWGYYKGNVDGIYGTKTFNAVKKFQSKNGLTIDGLVGTNTWSLLQSQVVGRGATSTTVLPN